MKAVTVLERIAPVQKQGLPVSAFAIPASRSSGNIRRIAYSEIMRGLVGPVAQVRRIIPQPARADAHARRQKVPYIHFAQEYPVAMELVQHSIPARSHDAGASDPGITVTTHFHVNPLEMGANQDRSRGVGRACQKPLGAPEEQVVTD